MNKTEFLQGLGLAPPEGEPQEIVVPADKLERVANKPASVSKRDNTNPKLEMLESKVKVLEERHQHNGEAANSRISELEGKLAVLEEAKLEREAVLESRIRELEEWKAAKLAEEEATQVEEIEAEADLCPKCGKDVGWDNLEVKEELNVFKVIGIFPGSGVDKFRQCPKCDYKEYISGEEAEVTKLETNSKKVKEEATQVEEVTNPEEVVKEKSISEQSPLSIIFG